MKQASNLQELLDNINKFPIFILSSPRSGSTVLSDAIAKTFPSLKQFNEPDNDPVHMAEFLNYISTSKPNYMLKAHGYSVWQPHPEYNIEYPREIARDLMHSNSIFKVSIRRRNIVKQIASLYIAKKRNKWIYDNTDVKKYNPFDEIDIDVEFIRFCIRLINRDYTLYNMCKTLDYNIFYEDIIVENEEISRTPLPVNYEILLNEIQKISFQMNYRF